MQEQDIKGALKLLSAVGFSKSNPVVFDLKAPDDDAALSGLAKAFVEQVNTASGGVVKATATTVAVGYWDTTYMAKGVNAFMTYYNPKPYFPQFSGMVFSYPETHFPEHLLKWVQIDVPQSLSECKKKSTNAVDTSFLTLLTLRIRIRRSCKA